MSPVPTTEVSQGVFYLNHPTHRDRTRGKSQWRITPQDEVGCFSVAHTGGWVIGHVGWGLHLTNGLPSYLGVAQDHSTQVFIAKFVDGNANNYWHGYPADYRNNQQDIPSEIVLKKWLDSGLLEARKISKIARSLPCSL